MAIKNNTINNLANVAIYHIETQCDTIDQDIIKKESKRLKNRLVRYGYPEPQASEAILEFTNYFANSN